MNISLNRYFNCLIFSALVLVFTSCGYKTDLVPPQATVPARIKDLRCRLDETGVNLTWSYPTKTTRGAGIHEIRAFELFRAAIPEKDYCPDCPVRFGPPLEIKGGPVIVDKKNVTAGYHESLLRPNHRYFYKVRSRAGWLLAGQDSNIVSFLWNTPADAPQDLKIKTGDKAVTLSWKRPAGLLDGSPVMDPMLFQVVRSRTGDDFRPIGEPTEGTTFTDHAVENGKIYFYRVRPIIKTHNTRAGGKLSKVVSGAPRDLTPPAPPRYITVIKTETGMRIVWEAAAEKDLAGHRIYRREAASRETVLIGETGASRTVYIDVNPPKESETWFYSVTSYDNAEPPNESIFSTEAIVNLIQ
ncbi:MAG: fibronectin type III domain-containing protein [Thermodesulfobacteriota bacterium]|nr:fibronectin type III domain-containing protein [Thermodesulfobacteriota bacterium]